MALCPSCNAELPRDAVLCVSCGFHLKKGKYLAAAVGGSRSHADLPADDDNPYRPPADAAGVSDGKSPLRQNYDLPTRIEYLEDRVRELERRIDATRLLAPAFFTRMLAVCGHVVLGYFLLVLIIAMVTVLVMALQGP